MCVKSWGFAVVAFDGDLPCFFGLFNDWLTGKAGEGDAILVDDWTDGAVVSFIRLSLNLERERMLEAWDGKWSDDSERVTTASW
jgi:hypothetical protein